MTSHPSPRKPHATLGRPGIALIAMVAAGLLAGGCHQDLERFDAANGGPHCGQIVSGQFTRTGYAPDLRMTLQLDISQLYSLPGTLSLSDGEQGPCSPEPSFDNAPLFAATTVFGDALSELQFGSARDHNFLAWVRPSCGQSTLAVISLMRDATVEVRLLRRGNASGPGDFGVFQLTREECVQ